MQPPVHFEKVLFLNLFFLKNYLKLNKDKAKFIAILNCEGLDLSGIDFCQYRNLVMVNLKGTPNNFEETQGDCYHDLSHGMYDFS